MRHLALLVALSLPLHACTNAEAPAKADAAAPTIRTATVEALPYTPTVELTGSADPGASVQLGFDVPGRIEKLLVHRGERVSVGDPIARLDDAMAAAQLAQAEAGMAAAKSQADAADASWARIEKMAEAVSGQQRTEAGAMRDGAHAQLEQARAAVRLARTNLGWHTLRSPIDGVITNGPDNAGILVGAGTPMFVVEDLSTLRVKATVPEEQGWIGEGMRVSVAGGVGTTATAEGVIERVIPSLDPATRRIPVEIRIDSPPDWLRAHSFVRAVVEGPPIDALSIPKGALVARPDFAVLVLENNAPKRVPVAVLATLDDKVIVRGALAAGTLVVVDPPHGYGE